MDGGCIPENIIFHCNNKSLEELSFAIEKKVGLFAVDSFFEIARLAQIANEKGVKPNVLVRVTAGIEAHTHEFVATAHEDQIDLFKEPVSATKSSNFKTEIRSHNATAGLLHLRWATEGMSVNENNTHPFCYQDISFIHNGSITPPDHLDPLIDKKYLALAKGNTDSERYFLYLLTQIDKYGFSEGVKAGVKYIKENLKYSAINMMIINKASFISACVYNQDKIPAKFKDDTDYYELKFTKKNGQVVIASSGWNQDGWQQIPNGSVLIIDRFTQSYKLEAL